MSGWLWLLVWAALFYFMMRFGCGAHMVHGHGGHGGDEHAGHMTGMSDAKDPVCGMAVASGQGYSEMYQGREFHFCSKKCLDKFDAEPQRYAA